MFPAHVIRDAAMAHKVTQLINDGQSEDKFIVLTGQTHMSYDCGVPERIW
jgi:uncharacterized iron-regulated protein